jgi:hypothetical protein
MVTVQIDRDSFYKNLPDIDAVDYVRSVRNYAAELAENISDHFDIDVDMDNLFEGIHLIEVGDNFVSGPVESDISLVRQVVDHMKDRIYRDGSFWAYK